PNRSCGKSRASRDGIVSAPFSNLYSGGTDLTSGSLLVGPLLRLPLAEAAAGFIRLSGLDNADDVGRGRGPGFLRQGSETRERATLERPVLPQRGDAPNRLIKSCVDAQQIFVHVQFH